MKKSVLLFVVLSLFVFVVMAQAEVVTYVGGQAIVDGNNTDPFGGGMQIAWGMPFSDKLMGWLRYDGFKTEEALNFDNGLIALTYMTPDVWPQLKMGMFATGQGGVSKSDITDSEWAFMGTLGFYFNVSTKMRLWVGYDYKDVAGGNRIYSFTAGLSAPVSIK